MVGGGVWSRPESVWERRMIYKDCQCYPRQITRADSLLKEIEAVSKRIIVKFKESYLEDPPICSLTL